MIDKFSESECLKIQFIKDVKTDKGENDSHYYTECWIVEFRSHSSKCFNASICVYAVKSASTGTIET